MTVDRGRGVVAGKVGGRNNQFTGDCTRGFTDEEYEVSVVNDDS